MSADLHIEHHPKDYYRQKAEAFLRQQGVWDAIPVPIEEIVEFKLGMDIVPLPALKHNLGVDAFLSRDLEHIYVDEYVFTDYYYHYRYALAREVARLVLHGQLFASHPVQTFEEYVAWRSGISEVDYFQLEWQAHCLAGLILVPPSHLQERFAAAQQRAEEWGVSSVKNWDVALSCAVVPLSREFEVSPTVIELRLRFDKGRARGSQIHSYFRGC